MKYPLTLILLLFIQCIIASFQCNPCRQKDMFVNNTKTWLPYRGTGQLAFKDNAGLITSFSATGIDTTVLLTTECGDNYKRQYITHTLYLSATDSMVFSVTSTSVLDGRAISNNDFSFSIFGLLQKAKEGLQAKNLSTYTVGTQTYAEAIMIFRNAYSTSTIDSVILANNAGIVGFNYNGKKYTLQ